MPLPVENEANESRTRSLGIKRSLATSQEAQQDVTSQPKSKKHKFEPQPGLKQRKKLARPIGEKYGFDSVEYWYQLKTRGQRKKYADSRRKAGRPPLPHWSDPVETEDPQTSNMSTLSTKDRAGPLAWNQGNSGTIRTSLRGTVAPAPDSRLGNNRLATGFGGTSTAAAPSPDSLESGETHSSPIEISSDEEEGGIQINVEGQAMPEVIHVDSDSGDDDDDDDDEDDDEDGYDMEEGEEDERAVISASVSSPVLGDRDAHMQLQGELERHLSNEFQPLTIDAAINKKPVVRLGDLSADELEFQYKYCFYGLGRDQIDLNRPVICVECLQEGHIHATCPEKYCTDCSGDYGHSKQHCPKSRLCTKCRERGHDATECQSKLKKARVCEFCNSFHHNEPECPLRFFPSIKPTNPTATVKLWISCCNCASKTHLVGDCPALHPDDGPRWSLRTIPTHQITNLSLQTGISGLEKAAENRNMRPQGRNIRPEKRQRQPPQNQRRTFEDSDEDAQNSFLRPAVSRQNQNQKGNINISFTKQNLQKSQSQFQPQRRSPDRDHDRYDRFDAPTTNNRSRGDWYQSDSFGQRRRSRSMSPAAYSSPRDFGGGDSYRPYDQPAQRRPNPSLSERISYAQNGRSKGYDRDRGLPAHTNERNRQQPPLPAEPPPTDSYRPTKSTYQGHGRGQGGAHGHGQGGKKQGAYYR
jgi:protein AIR1/2